jgi:hypothetical protein
MRYSLQSNHDITASCLYKAFEMFVSFHVLRWTNENKADVLTAVVTRGKLLAENAGDFMVFSMFGIVNDPVYAGPLNFLPRLELIANFWIRHYCLHYGPESATSGPPASGTDCCCVVCR